MAEQTFRSPGFFEREIDLTQRTTEIVGTPAGVIGTSIKGPAFVPVTVGSFADFESKFGTLDPDRFGPYAVNEWLKNRTALTYIRVLGAGSNKTTSEISLTQTAGVVKNAGFRLSGSRTEVSDARYNGTVQFLTAIHLIDADEPTGYPVFSDNNSVTSTGNIHLIRSMILTATGSRVMLLDHDQSFSISNASDDVASISAYDGTSEQGTFKLVLSSAIGSGYGNDESQAGLRIYTASLDPNSKHYVGNILNTNPDRFGAEQHLLYAEFPVEKEIAKVSTSAGSVGITSGSDTLVTAGGLSGTDFTQLFGRFDTRYQTAKTTSFISQPFGDKEFDLFHFESLDDGVAGNRRVKISISNLRRSTDPKNQFGTFTVLVRDYFDTDTDLRILEQYPLCTLDPSDENYVATKIGDFKASFNFDAETESERRLNVSGKRPNRSSFVRIVMNSIVEDGEVPAQALPFGFRGVPLIKTTPSLTDSSKTLLGAGTKNTSARARLGCVGSKPLTGSILPPVPMRFKATRGAVSSSPTFTGDPGLLELADSRLFFGVKFETVPQKILLPRPLLQANASGRRNKLIDSYSKFLGTEKSDQLATNISADLLNDNKFSLSKVAFFNQPASATQTLDDAVSLQNRMTGSVSDHMVEAAYIRNGVIDKPRYTIKDGDKDRLTFASLAAARSATAFNKFTEFMKFTNLMYGGFDGLNILDRDQRIMNDKSADVDSGGKAGGGTISHENLSSVSSPGTGKDNNIVSSYRTAISIITDPFASRVNIVSIPGQRSSFITDHAMEKTKEYSQAIYLMDIPPFNDDLVRLYDDATTRPNVRKTAEQFEGRALDNNYVATYFPDVIINDEVNGDAVNVPASVAAIGALGFNDRVAFPWFAPAGFNRGALESVLNTEVRLNAEDRNVLYETRINPIASFPDGGFVIFGQKTLQQARSALDRVNVRRMLLEVKRIVSDIANNLIFEQNTPVTRQRFIDQTKPRLARIQSNQGIDSFRVVMDSSNNSPEDAEQNRLNGRIVLVPTRAAEFIAIDFIITNSGVSFE